MSPSDTQPLAIVDLHSHLVPGVDDGTATVAESLSALAGLYREGVRTVVTTPHLLLGRLDTEAAVTRELDLHRQAFEPVQEACLERSDLPGIALGQEIWAADAATVRRVARRNDVGLNGNYLLVEFGFELQGTHVDVIREVLDAGRRIVIAHPERYEYLAGHDPIELMQRWRELGALLQVNVGSLTGHYRRSSPGSEELSWRMVELSLIDVLATDHHGPRRIGVSPRETLDALIARGELALAERAMVDNPGSIVRSEPVASRLPG
ncbi:MAG: CpsB/CapC family capsule biosynthesis tyrosine phosphatase [Gemmatimonadales bacterium]